MSDIDRQVAHIATGQHGAFTRAQAGDVGAGRSLIQRRLASGLWIPVAPGVLAVAGAPTDELQRLWVAHLSLGPAAIVSFESAGRLRGLDAMTRVVSLTVPHYDHRRRTGVAVHQQRIHEADWTMLRGLPVTTVERTLCDLAMVFSVARLRHVVHTAHLERLSTVGSIGSTFLRVGTVGRPGSLKLATVLDEFGPSEPVRRTELEARLDSVIQRSELPPAAAQHPLPGVGRRSGLVDRAYPEVKLIIEADGRRWHSRSAAMVSDRQRDFEAARLGWLTVRLMYEQLVGDPDDVALGLVETYRDRVRHVA